MFGYIIFVPLALSLLSTIVFNHSNRIVRVVLFLLPVVGVVFFLFLSTRYSDEINEKAQKSMSEAERKEYE
jgi:Ca2+/Na+ antiporter